ncbi:hypothetical protein LUZ60_016480 [Juncus effusus]|nr:hypothetical protein LUZ60_016480 [Juncus effusus]
MGIFFFIWFYFLLTTRSTVAHNGILAMPGILTKTGCQATCGDVNIPYPFGIGSNCSMEGFKIDCMMINDTYKPFAFNVEIMYIDLQLGIARMKNNISRQCYNATSTLTDFNAQLNLSSTPYRFSDVYNMFTTIGCESLAYIEDTERAYKSGCVSVCSNIPSLPDYFCSGIGCCQTPIPKGLNYYEVLFDRNFNSSHVWTFSRCSYAALLDSDLSEFNNYSNMIDFFEHNHQIPFMVDWAIGNVTCKDAIANLDSYARVSKNSDCFNSTNGLGYFCNCSEGYDGNPYLVDGCQDIDECASASVSSMPCGHGITCTNLPGGYECTCPSSYYVSYGNGYGACGPNKNLVLLVKLIIGFAILCGIPILVLTEYMLNKTCKKRRIKKTRQKNLKRHNDIIFRKHHDISGRMTVFGIEQLEKATNKFNQTLIVGRGGHGIIYKGILSDQRIVAVKKPKIKDDREIEEFLNEIVILSQLNHKNVVKLFGCCLESEVPLLVYEFISNGTLTEHLHVEDGQSLSWNDHLRIALETARALSYLHSAGSISIFHRDIKTSNILLNDGLITNI